MYPNRIPGICVSLLHLVKLSWETDPPLPRSIQVEFRCSLAWSKPHAVFPSPCSEVMAVTFANQTFCSAMHPPAPLPDTHPTSTATSTPLPPPLTPGPGHSPNHLPHFLPQTREFLSQMRE